MSKNGDSIMPVFAMTASIALMALLPTLASAATIDSLIDAATTVLISFVPIMISLAILVFFWGLVKFINHADDEKAIEEGKQLMLWGMIAIFIMVALWGIIGWIQHELGLDSSVNLGTLPAQPDTIP